MENNTYYNHLNETIYLTRYDNNDFYIQEF